jgi:hypothetical protein
MHAGVAVVVSVPPWEHFGVVLERRLTLGGTSLAVCFLTVSGTLREIFSRFGVPHPRVALPPGVVANFGRWCSGVLLPEDHATLLLQGGTQLEVVSFELDEHEQVESMIFPLDHPWLWRARDGHQVVVPASLFPEQ